MGIEKVGHPLDNISQYTAKNLADLAAEDIIEKIEHQTRSFFSEVDYDDFHSDLSGVIAKFICEAIDSGAYESDEVDDPGSVPPDGLWKGGEDSVYYTGTGQRLVGVHAVNSECWHYGCVVHNPTMHKMRGFKTHWRQDRGIMERICAHGVGHPDPDDMNYISRTRGFSDAQAESIHGCDGCCS